AGDQMVDWSRHDGLPSVIPAALSSGMVGIGVSHSDLGGFTSLFGKKRTKELFMRWAEHSAFTPIMRSHEGNRPDQNWQWDGDAETIQHLARMAKIYVALAPYRRFVLEEYYATGLPAMRPVVLHYPDRGAGDEGNGRRVSRYLLGRDLFVRPVVHPGVRRVTVDLPEDNWVHLWSGKRFPGGRAIVDAPFGGPPVFYRADSNYAEVFAGMADS
ncbi:MAG: alpha-glucosidase, partial [Spirochaetaceae bacterium]|nr:alpha-glucosidase [Spirochaetaceae bacterium]